MYVITDITPPVYLAVPMGPIFTFFVVDNFAIFLTLVTILGVFKNIDLKKQPFNFHNIQVISGGPSSDCINLMKKLHIHQGSEL